MFVSWVILWRERERGEEEEEDHLSERKREGEGEKISEGREKKNNKKKIRRQNIESDVRVRTNKVVKIAFLTKFDEKCY